MARLGGNLRRIGDTRNHLLKWISVITNDNKYDSGRSYVQVIWLENDRIACK